MKCVCCCSKSIADPPPSSIDAMDCYPIRTNGIHGLMGPGDRTCCTVMHMARGRGVVWRGKMLYQRLHAISSRLPLTVRHSKPKLPTHDCRIASASRIAFLTKDFTTSVPLDLLLLQNKTPGGERKISSQCKAKSLGSVTKKKNKIRSKNRAYKRRNAPPRIFEKIAAYITYWEPDSRGGAGDAPAALWSIQEGDGVALPPLYARFFDLILFLYFVTLPVEKKISR